MAAGQDDSDDELFRVAVGAIDAGNTATLEQLLAEHSHLAGTRLENQAPGCANRSATRLTAFSRVPTCSGSWRKIRCGTESCRRTSRMSRA